MTHPNAFAALITTGLADVVLKVAQHYGYLDITSVQALGAAGAIIAAVLFLGHRIWSLGIKGILLALWGGTQKVVTGKKS